MLSEVKTTPLLPFFLQNCKKNRISLSTEGIFTGMKIAKVCSNYSLNNNIWIVPFSNFLFQTISRPGKA